LKGNQLSNKFLDDAIKKEHPVVVSTSTGDMPVQTIINYDDYTVLLDDNDGLIQLIFKHAIVSISW